MGTNGISGNDAFKYLGNIGNIGKTRQSGNVAKTSEASISQPISFKESFGRKDLDNINPYSGVSFTSVSAVDKEIAVNTNNELKRLGFNYQVTGNQVASVSKGMTETVLPGMQSAADYAVELGVKDPKGPFAELFA